jgi:uncharacterized FlaG/YvyC family protein
MVAIGIRRGSSVFLLILLSIVLLCGNSFGQTNSTKVDTPENIYSAVVAELIKLRNSTSHDNALIYYYQAMNLKQGRPSVNPLSIVRDGWSKEAEALLPQFEEYKASFDLLRKGAKVGQSSWPASIKNAFPGGVVPNFNRLQICARMMQAQAAYFESTGDYQKALENYHTILIVGYDMGNEFCPAFSKSIGLSLEDNAIRGMGELLQSVKLSYSDLAKTASVLLHVEWTRAPIRPFIMSMLEEELGLLEQQLIKRDINALKHMDISDEQKRAWIANPDIPIKGMRQFHELVDKNLSAHYWLRDRDDFNRRRESLIRRLQLPPKHTEPRYRNVMRLEIKALCVDARRKVLMTAVALERYRRKNSKRPQKLDTLVPSYLEAVAADPFGGQPLHYLLMRGEYRLFSVGPDRINQSGKVPYSLGKGLDGRGDIYLVPRQPSKTVQLKSSNEQKRKERESRREEKIKKRAEALEEIISKLKKERTKTGRDNALIYYYEAGRMKLVHAYIHTMDVIRDGWSPKAEEFIPVFDKYAQSFELLRKGTRVGQAYWPPDIEIFFNDKDDDQVFLHLQMHCQMLAVQGQYFESLGQYEKALDNYQTIMMVACNIGVKNSPFVNRLVGDACEGMG